MSIELIQIFVQVIKNGSFTKAAEVLRLPKSSVSKAVARLEKESGTKLLVRTTRNQSLTNEGKIFYESCLGPLQAIEEAQKSLSGSSRFLSGLLKITAPEDLGTEIIAPTCGQLTIAHPGLNFELNYTDLILDLVKENYDLAIRIGSIKESGLKVRKIGEVKLVLVASPDFLKHHNKIHRPEDLKLLPCLNLNRSRSLWRLRSNSGGTAQITVEPRLTSNHMSSLIRAAQAGAGVALVPGFLARTPFENKSLARVLPTWTSQGLPVQMLSPLSFSSSTRLRVVSDTLIKEISKSLDDY